MITPLEPGQTLHVTGSSASNIEDELSAAVVLLRQRARDARQGILITRLGPGTYTVACDASVPYGVTDERDIWTSQGLCCGPDAAARDLPQ
ncbi:hypothetical protein [Arthrobacter sp. H-02-3]|uniref:hypothetical protein n=1 Tax=Arthrobacter sp. H-02-3 TaxID=2703675 RepID=UPI000DD19213|nr:hypothetical protein [Arthrobacter sp. H-02-3]PVZ55177.1 hypothetical protein C9424_14005 [Arthrobacter sp. H-02-3]